MDVMMVGLLIAWCDPSCCCAESFQFLPLFVLDLLFNLIRLDELEYLTETCS